MSVGETEDESVKVHVSVLDLVAVAVSVSVAFNVPDGFVDDSVSSRERVSLNDMLADAEREALTVCVSFCVPDVVDDTEGDALRDCDCVIESLTASLTLTDVLGDRLTE